MTRRSPRERSAHAHAKKNVRDGHNCTNVAPSIELVAGGVLTLALAIACSFPFPIGKASFSALAFSAFLVARHGTDVHRLLLLVLLMASRRWHRHLGGDVGAESLTQNAITCEGLHIDMSLISGGAFALAALDAEHKT